MSMTKGARRRPVRADRPRNGTPEPIALFAPRWGWRCVRCQKQCNERGLSRDGMGECFTRDAAGTMQRGRHLVDVRT